MKDPTKASYTITLDMGELSTPSSAVLTYVDEDTNGGSSNSTSSDAQSSDISAYGGTAVRITKLLEAGLSPEKALLIANTEFVPIATGEPIPGAATVNINWGEESTLTVTNVARLADIHRMVREYILKISQKLLSESLRFNTSDFLSKTRRIFGFLGIDNEDQAQSETSSDTSSEENAAQSTESTDSVSIASIDFMDCITFNDPSVERTLQNMLDKLAALTPADAMLSVVGYDGGQVNEDSDGSFTSSSQDIVEFLPSVHHVVNVHKNNPILKSMMEYILYDQILLESVKWLSGFVRFEHALKGVYSLTGLHKNSPEVTTDVGMNQLDSNTGSGIQSSSDIDAMLSGESSNEPQTQSTLASQSLFPIQPHGLQYYSDELLCFGKGTQDIQELYNMMGLLGSKCMLEDRMITIDHCKDSNHARVEKDEVFNAHRGDLAKAMMQLRRLPFRACLAAKNTRHNNTSEESAYTILKNVEDIRNTTTGIENTGLHDLYAEMFAGLCFDSIYEIAGNTELDLELPGLIPGSNSLEPEGQYHNIGSYLRFAFGENITSAGHGLISSSGGEKDPCYAYDDGKPETEHYQKTSKFANVHPTANVDRHGALGTWLSKLRTNPDGNKYAPLESNRSAQYYSETVSYTEDPATNLAFLTGPENFIGKAMESGDFSNGFTEFSNFIDSYATIANAFANDILKLTGLAKIHNTSLAKTALTPLKYVKNILTGIAEDFKTMNSSQGEITAPLLWNHFAYGKGSDWRVTIFKQMICGLAVSGQNDISAKFLPYTHFNNIFSDSDDRRGGFENAMKCLANSSSLFTEALVGEFCKAGSGMNIVDAQMHSRKVNYVYRPDHKWTEWTDGGESWLTEDRVDVHRMPNRKCFSLFHVNENKMQFKDVPLGDIPHRTQWYSEHNSIDNDFYNYLDISIRKTDFGKTSKYPRVDGKSGYGMSNSVSGLKLSTEAESLTRFLSDQYMLESDSNFYGIFSAAKHKFENKFKENIYGSMLQSSQISNSKLNSLNLDSKKNWSFEFKKSKNNGKYIQNVRPYGPVFQLSIHHRAFIYIGWVGQLLARTVQYEGKSHWDTENWNETFLYFQGSKAEPSAVCNAIKNAISGNEDDRPNSWSFQKQAYDQAYNMTANLLSKIAKRQKQIIECAKTLKFHASKLKRRKNWIIAYSNGQHTSKRGKLALNFLKNNGVLDSSIQLLSEQSMASSYASYINSFRSSPSFPMFSYDDTYSLKRLKLMMKILSKENFGLQKSESQGNKTVFHVGLTNSMIKEMGEKAYFDTGDERYLKSSKIAINIFKKNQLNSYELLYPKSYVFDANAHILDTTLEGNYATHIENFNDMMSFEDILNNVGITRFSINLPDADGSSEGSIPPDSMQMTQTLGQGITPTGINDREVMINHVFDYAFKIYYNVILGLDFNESTFILNPEEVLDYSEPKATAVTGQANLTAAYELMKQNLTKLYPASNVDPKLSAEFHRVMSAIRSSAPFALMNKVKKVFHPKMFDRVFSIMVNEKDFILHKDSVNKEWTEIFVKKPNFKYTSEIYRPETLNDFTTPDGQITLTAEQLEATDSTAISTVVKKYKASCLEDFPEVYTYYMTVSILPNDAF